MDFAVKPPDKVDFMSKRTHFIPIHMTVTIKDAARLFLHYI